jgi:hypothetical protein
VAIPTSNRLLSCLSDESHKILMNLSTPVDLPIRSCLFDAEQTPPFAYFVTSGMASIVTSMKMVEPRRLAWLDLRD